ADKDLALGDRQRTKSRLSKGIGGQNFEFRTGLEHKGVPRLIHHVQALPGPNHGGPGVTLRSRSFESLFPDRLAGLEIQALRHSRIVVDIDMPSADHSRADSLPGFGDLPKPPRIGHITVATRPDCQG